jgi:hypothetical protein
MSVAVDGVVLYTTGSNFPVLFKNREKVTPPTVSGGLVTIIDYYISPLYENFLIRSGSNRLMYYRRNRIYNSGNGKY